MYSYLELCRQVEGNGVVLCCSLEVLVWVLYQCDDGCGHADLLVVNIVARNVSEQFLQTNPV